MLASLVQDGDTEAGSSPHVRQAVRRPARRGACHRQDSSCYFTDVGEDHAVEADERPGLQLDARWRREEKDRAALRSLAPP